MFLKLLKKVVHDREVVHLKAVTRVKEAATRRVPFKKAVFEK